MSNDPYTAHESEHPTTSKFRRTVFIGRPIFSCRSDVHWTSIEHTFLTTLDKLGWPMESKHGYPIRLQQHLDEVCTKNEYLRDAQCQNKSWTANGRSITGVPGMSDLIRVWTSDGRAVLYGKLHLLPSKFGFLLVVLPSVSRWTIFVLDTTHFFFILLGENFRPN